MNNKFIYLPFIITLIYLFFITMNNKELFLEVKESFFALKIDGLIKHISSLMHQLFQEWKSSFRIYYKRSEQLFDPNC